MNMVEFTVEIVTTWSTADIQRLYEAGGWWKPEYDFSRLPSLIEGSFAFAVAVESSTQKTIGMGRVISDGVSDAYIQDVVVLPNFRRHSIGTQIIKTLVDFCHSKHINWIGLIAEPGSEQFYQELGFHKMKDHLPMLYHEDK